MGLVLQGVCLGIKRFNNADGKMRRVAVILDGMITHQVTLRDDSPDLVDGQRVEIPVIARGKDKAPVFLNEIR